MFRVILFVNFGKWKCDMKIGVQEGIALNRAFNVCRFSWLLLFIWDKVSLCFPTE